MVVTFAKVVLAAGGTEGPSGLTIVPSRSIQTVDLVRARYGVQFPRGNVRYQISFGVTKSHRTVDDAVVYLVDHPQALPNQGTLALLNNDSGRSSAGRWFRDAVLVRAEPVRLVGLTTIWTYAFVAGEPLRRDPATSPAPETS